MISIIDEKENDLCYMLMHYKSIYNNVFPWFLINNWDLLHELL